MSLLNDLQGMYDPGSKRLSLDTSKLGATGTSLSNSTGSPLLLFDGVQAAPAEASGIISFEGSSLQLSGGVPLMLFPAGQIASVSCEVYQADSTPVFVISAKLAAGWKFSGSFPWLAQTFWDGIVVKPATSVASQATLFVSSGQVKEPTFGVNLSEGVAFYGILDEKQGLLQWASWMLGSGPGAYGAIMLSHVAPPVLTLNLAVNSSSTAGLGAIFKDLNVPIEASLVFQTGSPTLVSGLHLAATLSWAGSPIKVETAIPGSGNSVIDLTVDGPLPLPTPEDLTRYLGGNSVTQYLPGSFSTALSSIHVGQVTLGVGAATMQLEYARVILTTLENATLTIVPKWVEIGDISFAVTIFNPLGSNISASYMLSGTLDIGGVDLLVSANLVMTPRSPNLTVVVQLGEGDVIDLTMIAEKFGLPKGAPEIIINEFQMGGSTSGTYFIRAALSEHPVGPSQNGFILSSLIFELDYQDSQPNINIEGVMFIAGVDATISLSNNAGWEIAGTAGEEQPVKIGDLLADLGSKFGISVPAPIASLELRKLKFTYSTETGRFFFTCEGDFTIADTPVALTITIDVTQTQTGDATKPSTVTGNKGYSATFGGNVTFSGLSFDLIFHTESLGTNAFVASYSHTGNQSAINLHDLIAAISSDMASVIPSSINIDLKDVKFIFFQQDQTKQFSFGLDLGTSISLSDLPLVGDKLPPDLNIAVNDLQFVYSSAEFKATQITIINTLLPGTVSKLPAQGMPQGLNVSASIQFGPPPPLALSLGGSNQQTQPVKTTTNQPTGGTTPPVATQPTTTGGATGTTSSVQAGGGDASSSTKWFDVQKQFGVFQFKRIGVGYENNILLFSLDAAITLGPLMLSVAGLSFGSSLTKFTPTFDITGLGLSYVKPPLEITGALLKVPGAQLAPDVKFQFDGMAVIKAEAYSLSAIGSYAQFTNGDPSLFVFAQLEAALGGPPAFFVTGLMAGFGFNRLLEIPAQNEVMGFPLLVLGQPPAPGSPVQSQDPMHVLDILEGRVPITTGGATKQWIRPSPGDYWLAVGIEFMSFELVTSKALLIVEFGHDFQIVLLGLSTMRLPQASIGGQSYAYVELQLKAVLRPQDGFFGLTAILSANSFVITPDCHLTGGFAFYLWFGSNDNAGQFVITLGGYHPAFKPPSYFPQVPRLGFNWAVSSSISIKGDAYFALTTSCVMAGGGLEAVYQDGDLRAWFTAHADLLISWHPFFFLAHIDVEIGVSYRLNLLFCHKTISVSVGATVDLWGPPTGGKVHVHLSILSFTVQFGSDGAGQQNDPLAWTEFKTLLPSPNDVCKITVSDGLYKTQDSAASTSGKAWIVRATKFACFTQSTIPASHLRYGTTPVEASTQNAEQNFTQADTTVDIRPMNKSGVTSVHRLNIYKDSVSTNPVDVSKWTLTARYQNLPESLWGAPPTPFKQIPDKPTANVIPNQMVGYAVQSPPPAIAASRGVVPLKELSEEYILPPNNAPLSTVVVAVADYVPSFNKLTVAQIQQIMQGTAKQNRDALYNALQGASVYGGTNGALTNMASNAGHLFSDSPMQQN